MKKYRFFYHYYKQYNMMSLHFKGKCYKSKNIICNVPCETHYNNKHPKLIMRGYCKQISIKDNTIKIS